MSPNNKQVLYKLLTGSPWVMLIINSRFFLFFLETVVSSRENDVSPVLA